MRRSGFLLALAVVCAASPANADRFDALRAAVPAMLAERKVPSLAIAVAQNGKIIWEQGFGLANKDKNIPATSDTLYSIPWRRFPSR